MKIFTQIPVINCVLTSWGIDDKSFDDRILYFMGAKRNLPVDYIHPESKLKFIKQTVFAKGNHIRRRNKEKQIRAKALYQCVCGKQIEVQIDYVKRGHTRSCGCWAKQNPSGLKHGLYYHPLYRILNGIIQRCENKNHPYYYLYGGDGVYICNEWRDNPELFIKWALENGWEKGMEIDKDFKGGKMYSPDNCTIVTRLINCNKRRNNHFLNYNGKVMTMADWARETGINEDCISMRIKHGWTIERTLTEPLREKVMHEYNGESKTLSEWSAFLGISKATILTRLNRGWSIEKALMTPIKKNNKKQ